MNQHLKSVTGIGDVSIRLNNSRIGRKTPNKKKKKKKRKRKTDGFLVKL